MESYEIVIKRVRTDTQLRDIKELVQEYLKTIPYDLSFQDIEKEMQDMPGKYVVEQGGELLLAYVGSLPAGCVAVRELISPQENRACEMKRLYVRPSYRKRSVGSRLVQEIIGVAKELKYSVMRLDSLKQFESATKLYEKEGFKSISNYNSNPIAEAVFYERNLDEKSQ